MKFEYLIQLISHKLADELLSPTQLLKHMDSVIDDINTQLNSAFHTFTEEMQRQGTIALDYTAIPDKYLRSVVVVGAATKYYEIDEEGNPAAQSFAQDYNQQLFYMLRDYSFSVPEQYRVKTVQGVIGLDNEKLNNPGLSLDSNLIF